MNAKSTLAVGVCLCIFCSQTVAGTSLTAMGPPSPAATDEAAGFAATLRAILLTMLPTPLYENHKHWNQQKMVTEGLKWKGQGIRVHPSLVKGLQNDGLWWRVTLRSPNIADNLRLEVKDLQQPELGRMLFTTVVTFDADVDYERQRWEAGLKLWSGSVRARMRVQLSIRCEWTTRYESNGTLLPDTVLRFRVLSSDLKYDKLVVEHINGLGGELAKVLGETAVKAIHQLNPSLERHLLEKANAAIIKAGDSKEVRISLKSLFGKR